MVLPRVGVPNDMEYNVLRKGTLAENWRDHESMEPKSRGILSVDDFKKKMQDQPPPLFATGVAKSLIDLDKPVDGSGEAVAVEEDIREDEAEESAMRKADRLMAVQRAHLERQLFVSIGRRALNFTVGMAIETPSIASIALINTAISTFFAASLTTTTKDMSPGQAKVWLFHEVPLDFWNEMVYRESISSYKRDVCDMLELLAWEGSLFKAYLGPGDAKAAQLLAEIVIGGIGPIANVHDVWQEVCAHPPQLRLSRPLIQLRTTASPTSLTALPMLSDADGWP